MDIKQQKIEKNTAWLTLTANEKQINEAIAFALKKLSPDLTIKGFRKGKVPQNIAEKEIGQDKLKQEGANYILEQGILQIIKEGKYKIIGRPQLEKADIKNKNNWKFTLILPLMPKIDLSGYREVSKKALQKTKGKNKEQQVSAIINSLLKKINFQIPPVLVERKIDYSLSRLVKHVETLNLSMDTFLKSINRTPETIKQEYRQKAQESLKLELILSEIAQDLQIKVSQKDLKKFALVSQVPLQKQDSLRPILIRRKALDQLLTL